MDLLLSMRNLKRNKSIPSNAKRPPLSKLLLALKMPVSHVMMTITLSASNTKTTDKLPPCRMYQYEIALPVSMGRTRT